MTSARMWNSSAAWVPLNILLYPRLLVDLSLLAPINLESLCITVTRNHIEINQKRTLPTRGNFILQERSFQTVATSAPWSHQCVVQFFKYIAPHDFPKHGNSLEVGRHALKSLAT